MAQGVLGPPPSFAYLNQTEVGHCVEILLEQAFLMVIIKLLNANLPRNLRVQNKNCM